MLMILFWGFTACKRPDALWSDAEMPGECIHNPDAANMPESALINPHKPPVFPEGEAALLHFLHEWVKYSPRCSEYIGVSAISFDVNADGSVSDLKILKLAHPSLEPMIREMFAQMPRWAPGEVSGKPARTRMILPIRVCLQ